MAPYCLSRQDKRLFPAATACHELRLPATESPPVSSHLTENKTPTPPGCGGSWYLPASLTVTSWSLPIPLTLTFIHLLPSTSPRPPQGLCTCCSLCLEGTPTSSYGRLLVTLQLSANTLVTSSPEFLPSALYHISLLDFSCATCQLLSFSQAAVGLLLRGMNLAVHCSTPSPLPWAWNTSCVQRLSPCEKSP